MVPLTTTWTVTTRRAVAATKILVPAVLLTYRILLDSCALGELLEYMMRTDGAKLHMVVAQIPAV